MASAGVAWRLWSPRGTCPDIPLNTFRHWSSWGSQTIRICLVQAKGHPEQGRHLSSKPDRLGRSLGAGFGGMGGTLVQGDLVPGYDGTPLSLHRAKFQDFLHSERPVTFTYAHESSVTTNIRLPSCAQERPVTFMCT